MMWYCFAYHHTQPINSNHSMWCFWLFCKGVVRLLQPVTGVADYNCEMPRALFVKEYMEEWNKTFKSWLTNWVTWCVMQSSPCSAFSFEFNNNVRHWWSCFTVRNEWASEPPPFHPLFCLWLIFCLLHSIKQVHCPPPKHRVSSFHWTSIHCSRVPSSVWWLTSVIRPPAFQVSSRQHGHTYISLSTSTKNSSKKAVLQLSRQLRKNERSMLRQECSTRRKFGTSEDPGCAGQGGRMTSERTTNTTQSATGRKGASAAGDGSHVHIHWNTPILDQGYITAALSLIYDIKEKKVSLLKQIVNCFNDNHSIKSQPHFSVLKLAATCCSQVQSYPSLLSTPSSQLAIPSTLLVPISS